MTVRIAMWSGPRNISTAMMRSFGARRDCFVSDEPFYGCFLKDTGADHPMAAQVIAAMDCDWHSAANDLAGDPPGGEPLWYQKHMTHHMTGPVQPDELESVRHAFLIREPARMIASYLGMRDAVTADDLGYHTQRALFERIADRQGFAPPVVDSADVLRDPAGTLAALCGALNIAWDPAMLNWEPGGRPTDGAWSPHWYARVEASTCFAAPDESAVELPPETDDLLAECRRHYEALREHALAAQQSHPHQTPSS